MTIRFALLAVLLLSLGCATYSSMPLNRSDDHRLTKERQCGVKGVPIAVQVPSHLDLYIEETFYLLADSEGIFREVPLTDHRGLPQRNLGIRTEMIRTKKIFVVDFKRAAAGTSSSGLKFNDDQYLEEITGEIEDETLEQATEAFTAIAPLLSGRPTSAGAETRRLNSEAVSGTRVVAYRRFDLNAPDFEQQVSDFVDLHMNACHDCGGSQSLPGWPAEKTTLTGDDQEDTAPLQSPPARQ